MSNTTFLIPMTEEDLIDINLMIVDRMLAVNMNRAVCESDDIDKLANLSTLMTTNLARIRSKSK